jgi:hypothetical protein
MHTTLVEATNGPHNWGKFLVGAFDAVEWARPAAEFPGRPLLPTIGWTPGHVLVLDLQTGEGAVFRLGGYPKADLDKHRIWVCPLFEPFLDWLYGEARRLRLDGAALLDALPAHVDLPDAPFSMQGYRRPGPEHELRSALQAIHTTARGDEKGECWTIRRWLDARDVFNGDISGETRLIEEVCKYLLKP